MKQLGKIYDPVYEKKANLNFIDRIALRMIRDERDLPFIYLTLKITFTIIPLAVLLYFTDGWLWWAIAAVYFFLNNLYFKGPFGLMLHCTSHRRFFKKEYDFLNYYQPWILAPFFGHTPETYFIHHIGMHHVENNLEEDESSTMEYQRDKFSEFLKYWANFLFKGVYTLYLYHKKRNRKQFLANIVIGEISFYALCIVLSFINFPATFMAFIFPFLIFRFITMLGNWTQHSFIDPNDPENLYKSSINCINVKYNKKCWNDGYHIVHHVRPNLHYTEHPGAFLKDLDNHAKNKAIVFDGLDYLKIFYYLMNKRYDVLAKHFVNIHDTFQSDEEVIALLKERTQKIPAMVPQPAMSEVSQ